MYYSKGRGAFTLPTRSKNSIGKCNHKYLKWIDITIIMCNFVFIWVNWPFSKIQTSLHASVHLQGNKKQLRREPNVYRPRDLFGRGPLSPTVHHPPLAQSPWCHSIYPPTPINTLIDRLSVDLCAYIGANVCWKFAICACQHALVCVCWTFESVRGGLAVRTD